MKYLLEKLHLVQFCSLVELGTRCSVFSLLSDVWHNELICVLGLKIMGKDMLRLSVSPSANQLQDRTVLIPTTRAKYFCSFSPKKKMSS